MSVHPLSVLSTIAQAASLNKTSRSRAPTGITVSGIPPGRSSRLHLDISAVPGRALWPHLDTSAWVEQDSRLSPTLRTRPWTFPFQLKNMLPCASLRPAASFPAHCPWRVLHSPLHPGN